LAQFFFQQTQFFRLFKIGLHMSLKSFLIAIKLWKFQTELRGGNHILVKASVPIIIEN
jgi:hypothetical protein